MYREIAQLLHENRLNEAYQRIQALPEDFQMDTNTKRIYGMLLAAIIQRDAEKYYFDSALNYLSTFCDAHFPEDEVGVFKALTESLQTFITRLTERSSNEQLLDKLFDLIQQQPIHVAGFPYVLLIKKILKIKTWKRVGEFAYWCGWEHLRDDDFKPYTMQNGKQVMSLAEQICIRISKYLLENQLHDDILTFIPQLTALYQAHPKYTYPPYFLAKLYLSVSDFDNAQQTLFPFIRKKSNDFWVWQLMAECQSSNEDKLPYYAKALQCGSRKEEMLISLYEGATKVFIQTNHFGLAKWLIERACDIRIRNNWRLTPELLDLTRQPWFTTTQALHDQQQLNMLASRAEQQAHIKPNTAKSKHQQTQSNSRIPFSGKIRITATGLGFVHDTKLGDIFVPPHMVANLQNNDSINGVAEKSFDNKKQQWGYRAVKIRN